MTSCVAMLRDTRMVFLSDSRTSAGVHQISTRRPAQGRDAAPVQHLLGDFIEATAETSHFQIGESKYGDRVVRRSSSLNETAKAALVSMHSTIRSNLSVGLPLDLVLLKRDQYEIAHHISIDDDNAYCASIRKRWSEALRQLFVQLPEPDFLRSRLLG